MSIQALTPLDFSGVSSSAWAAGFSRRSFPGISLSGRSSAAEKSTRSRGGTEYVRPSGTHEFAIKDSAVALGKTGLTVTISDLSLSSASGKVAVGGNVYRLPSWTPAGAARLSGTDEMDKIRVTQDSAGDTMLDVAGKGSAYRLNLGRIASFTIDGLAGDDDIQVDVKDYFGGVVVNAGAGDDKVELNVKRAFSRGVTVDGGEGDDKLKLSGFALAAILRGGAGNDQILADSLMPDVGLTRHMHGDDGADVLRGTSGNDMLDGGAGDDVLDGGAGKDRLLGWAGNDTLFGGLGADMLWGGVGDDRLAGNAGDDLLFGEDGSDVLEAGQGDDTLLGGAGADFLYAGDGYDVLHGGAGADNFGPIANQFSEIHAFGSNATHLKVMARGVSRLQNKVTSLSPYLNAMKALTDYDAGTDYLVDVNELA